MKELSKLRNIHTDEDIYVICGGASLNWIPNNFFDGKITVGINQVYRKIKTNYLIRKDPKFINESTLVKSKILISKHQHGNTAHKLNVVGGKNNNVYIYEHNKNTGKGKIDYSDHENKMIVSWSTTTTGIHIAAYFGAKNIILVGHDCGTINGKSTFDGYYNGISDTPWKNWKEYENWLSNIENQTLEVKRFIQEKYKCNILSINPFINYNLEGNTFNGKNNIN